MKGEETEDFQADSTPNPKGGKKRARNVTVNALRVIIKNSRIFEQTSTDRLADSASQATIVNEDHIELCSDLMPIDGDIVTAAGEVMGIIKFKGTICFMGVRIDCLVADINTTIVSSGQTALENGFKWTFGPYAQGEVTSTTNNVTIPLISASATVSPLIFTSVQDMFTTSENP